MILGDISHFIPICFGLTLQALQGLSNMGYVTLTTWSCGPNTTILGIYSCFLLTFLRDTFMDFLTYTYITVSINMYHYITVIVNLSQSLSLSQCPNHCVCNSYMYLYLCTYIIFLVTINISMS